MQTVKHKVILLKSLLYLKDIIDLGKIQKSADKNGIKQSNLSQLINELEEEFHAPLLYKTTNGVLPTNAAQQIYEDINEIEEILARIQSNFNQKEEPSGTVSLWAGTGLTETRLLSMVSDFYALYPKLRLNILTGQEVNLTDVDLVLVHNHMSSIPNGTRLFTTQRQIHFYTTEEYIKKHGEPKDFKDLLENYDLCLEHSILKWPETKEINKYAKHLNTTTDIMSVVLTLVKSGSGIALLPDWCQKNNPMLVRLKNVDFCIPFEFYLICKKGFEKHKKIQILSQLLNEAFNP